MFFYVSCCSEKSNHNSRLSIRKAPMVHSSCYTPHWQQWWSLPRHVACCRVAAAGNCCLFHPSPGVQTTQLMTASVSAAAVWLLSSECWPIIAVCLVQWSTVAGDNCPVMTGAGGRGRGTIVSSRRRESWDHRGYVPDKWRSDVSSGAARREIRKLKLDIRNRLKFWEINGRHHIANSKISTQ